MSVDKEVFRLTMVLAALLGSLKEGAELGQGPLNCLSRRAGHSARGPSPLRNLNTPSTSFGVGIHPFCFDIVRVFEIDHDAM